MIVPYAPVRLLRLEFKRLETLIRQELQVADAEISDECAALSAQRQSIAEIFKRHEAKFKYGSSMSNCESYMKCLRNCAQELAEQNVDDKANVDEILNYLQSYWKSLVQKIDTMSEKLTILPNAIEDYETNVAQFTAWLGETEKNAANITNNNLSSLFEYRRSLEKIKVNHNLKVWNGQL